MHLEKTLRLFFECELVGFSAPSHYPSLIITAEAKNNKSTRAQHNERPVAPQTEIFWWETKAAACKPENSVFHSFLSITVPFRCKSYQSKMSAFDKLRKMGLFTAWRQSSFHTTQCFCEGFVNPRGQRIFPTNGANNPPFHLYLSYESCTWQRWYEKQLRIESFIHTQRKWNRKQALYLMDYIKW